MINEGDRELLELAAKAAGVEYTISPHGNLLAHHHPGGGEMRVWNPLADDGDALRLANRLRINIYNGDPESTVCGRSGISGFRVDVQSDADAATRRAIVLAAAELAKSK